MPILVVIGIKRSGEREVLGFSVGDRENQRAWEGVFEDLKHRGVKEVGLLITDGHQAMLNASLPSSQELLVNGVSSTKWKMYSATYPRSTERWWKGGVESYLLPGERGKMPSG